MLSANAPVDDREKDGMLFYERKVYHAVQELFAQHAHPVGCGVLKNFIHDSREVKLRETLASLVELGFLLEATPGTWVPSDVVDLDAVKRRAFIKKEIIRSSVQSLTRALHGSTPEEFTRYAKQWLADLDALLG